MTTVSRTAGTTPTLFTADNGDLSILWPNGTTSVLQSGSTNAAPDANPLAVTTVAAVAGVTYSAKKTPARGWVKAVVDKAAWVAAATTQQILVATLPAKTMVVAAYLDTTVKLAGLAGTIQMSLGTSGGGYVDLVTAADVKTAAVTQGLAIADLGALLQPATFTNLGGDGSGLATAPIQGGALYSLTATTGIKVNLSSGTGNIGSGTVTNLTTGSTTVYLLLEQLP